MAQEISSYGGTNVEQLVRAVSFEGDLEVVYKANLWSRTALRVLKPILQFKAHNETVLYKRLRRFSWTDLIGLEQTFKVNSSVHSDQFTHSKYVALKTKDAIIDEFRLQYDSRRPSIDLDQPDFGIDVHCNGIDFTISLDSSGTSLHKRGYRQSQRQAPLNETLAAGMIMLSGWDLKTPFLDPMCGSGTLLTEAVMMVRNIAPRLERSHFAFMNWSDYDPDLWLSIKDQARSSIIPCQTSIIGYDSDPVQIRETRALLDELNMKDDISLDVKDFFESEKPAEQGVIIMNPPYGLRLEEEDIEGFYRQIGDTFKKKYQGWTAWLISGNKKAIKSIGLRTSKKLTLFNGSIECKYHRFDMYSGTKKKSAVQ